MPALVAGSGVFDKIDCKSPMSDFLNVVTKPWNINETINTFCV